MSKNSPTWTPTGTLSWTKRKKGAPPWRQLCLDGRGRDKTSRVHDEPNDPFDNDGQDAPMDPEAWPAGRSPGALGRSRVLALSGDPSRLSLASRTSRLAA